MGQKKTPQQIQYCKNCVIMMTLSNPVSQVKNGAGWMSVTVH